MIYGPWAIVIGHCIAGLCYFDSAAPAPFNNTFSDEFTCEITGKLIDDIGTNRAMGPIEIKHYCYNWVEDLAKDELERQRKRTKGSQPVKSI